MNKPSGVAIKWSMPLLLMLLQCGCVTTTNSIFTESASSDAALKERVALARNYIGTGNWEDAKRNLELAAEIDPDSAGVHEAFGLVYERTGEYELAEENYKKAVRIDPGLSRARNNYAAFLYNRKRYAEAEKQLTYVVKDVLYAERARAFAFLGLCQLHLDKDDDAEKAFLRAYAMNRNSSIALLELVQLNYDKGTFGQAERYYDAYRKVIRQQSSRALWLGIRLAREVGDKDAEASYGLALSSLYPKSPEQRAYEQSQWVE